MKYIILQEYSKKGKEIVFSSSKSLVKFKQEAKVININWKIKLGLSNNPFYWIEHNNNTISLFVRGVTGFITISDYSIEIQPKFLDNTTDNKWKLALINLLFFQENPVKYKTNLIDSTDIKESLPDLLARRFIKELENGLLLGLPKDYVYKEESSTYYRGTYNTNKAIKHLVQPYLIPIKFDEYVEDKLVNRIIKLATIQLSKQVKDNKLSIELDELSYRIDASLQVPSRFEIDSAILPLQFGYLDTAFELSKLILKNESIIFSNGKLKNSGFLWSTHTIFEGFLKKLIKMFCRQRKNYRFTDQKIHLYTLANRFTVSREKGYTSPDIRIFEGSSLKWLLDAKYKNWKNGPESSDLYQVITGAQLSNIERASLIYPKGTNTPSEQIFYNLNTMNLPKFITCIFIDLLKLSESNGLELILNDLIGCLENQLK